MTAQNPSDIDRLRKLAGRLDDGNSNEAATAWRLFATMATRLNIQVTEARELVFSPALTPPPAQSARPSPMPVTTPWQRPVIRCLDVMELFTPWERTFLTSIASARSFSDKQAATLDGLYAIATRHFDAEMA